ncbi:hypothetical protein BZG36_05646 [Bifiguratus adelaidae]|uniref:Transcription factor domain-containing protein n=1 Tax=Bifiguratus adelaidae TaxID=1938954 RepID=A0A261XT00_9FUNG|nr:hypothetical protein BZG36_05646 [Bifiguratus adelaidae]
MLYDEFRNLDPAIAALSDEISILSSRGALAYYNPDFRTVPPPRSSPSSDSSVLQAHLQTEANHDSRAGDCSLLQAHGHNIQTRFPSSIVLRASDGRLLKWIVSPNGTGLSIFTNLHSLEELSLFTTYGWHANIPCRIIPNPSIPKTSSRPVGNSLRVRERKCLFTNPDHEMHFRRVEIRRHSAAGGRITAPDLEPRRWIFFLLKTYFSLNLPPYLHESTFWKQYALMGDPMQSALVMAICATVTTDNWQALNTLGDRYLSSAEAKRLCEYYASCAQEFADEIFDDEPLNALKTFALLIQHHKITQPVKSSVTLTCHALRIGYSMQSKYTDVLAMNNISADIAIAKVEAQEWLRIMWSIYEFLFWEVKSSKSAVILQEDSWARLQKLRYFSTSHGDVQKYGEMRNSNQIISRTELATRIQELPYVDILPDEGDEKRGVLENYRHVTALWKKDFKPNNPFSDMLRNVIFDVPEYVSIDFYLKVEQSLLDWYLQIPSEIRYTDSPLRPISMEELIRNAATYSQLEALGNLWSRWITIHLRFLPESMNDFGSPIYAQERFVHNALATCIVLSRNMSTSLFYIFHHLKRDIHLSYLRLACQVNWVVANTEGLDAEYVLSAKRDLLTSLFTLLKCFCRFNINPSISASDSLRLDTVKSEVILHFTKNQQLAEYLRGRCGFGLRGQELELLLAVLRSDCVQNFEETLDLG